MSGEPVQRLAPAMGCDTATVIFEDRECDSCFEERSREDLRRFPLFHYSRPPVDVDAQPECKRFCEARNRKNRVAADLLNEYVLCFHAVLTSKTREYVEVVLRCADASIWLALATGMPILYDSVMAEIKTQPIAILAIAKIFLNHLRKSWFSLENSRLEAAYSKVRDEYVSQKYSRELADASSESDQSSDGLLSPTDSTASSFRHG